MWETTSVSWYLLHYCLHHLGFLISMTWPDLQYKSYFWLQMVVVFRLKKKAPKLIELFRAALWSVMWAKFAVKINYLNLVVYARGFLQHRVQNICKNRVKKYIILMPTIFILWLRKFRVKMSINFYVILYPIFIHIGTVLLLQHWCFDLAWWSRSGGGRSVR